MEPDEQLLSTVEVAGMLRVAPRTVRYWADVALLPGFKVGKLWRFRKFAISTFIAKQQENAGLE